MIQRWFWNGKEEKQEDEEQEDEGQDVQLRLGKEVKRMLQLVKAEVKMGKDKMKGKGCC